MLTGHGDVQHAVMAMRLGAVDFLEKPYDAEHLLSVIERTLRTQRLTTEIARLQNELAHWSWSGFIGESRVLAHVREMIERLAPMQIDVVFCGETGTGKELAARILHRHGSRSAGPFEVIDCGALHGSAVDAELFGLSAPIRSMSENMPGRIEAADGGTLFLDHADAMPLHLQPRLLRFLETRQIVRGNGQSRQLDVRVVAAASVPLKEQIHRRLFREDLYYRLAGYEVSLPPLRMISTDVPRIFDHFVSEAAARHGRDRPELNFQDRKALQTHHWPGNARELRIVAERYVLGLTQLQRSSGDKGSGVSAGATLKDLVETYEAQEIARVLDQCRGNTASAAKVLGIPRRTLNAKISRFPWLKK
jgi:two-component system, NtrC family, C4-dicarboxylate transport response regulator DctD